MQSQKKTKKEILVYQFIELDFKTAPWRYFLKEDKADYNMFIQNI